jgi:CRISPR-associated endonuclease/helicase Cas3
MSVFWAKPDQTYEDHIISAYESWKSVVDNLEPFIQRNTEKYNYSKERLIQGSLISVLLHDIGKMSDIFQEMMETIKKGKTLIIVKTTDMNCYLFSIFVVLE